jgi:hypothetical protein
MYSSEKEIRVWRIMLMRIKTINLISPSRNDEIFSVSNHAQTRHQQDGMR